MFRAVIQLNTKSQSRDFRKIPGVPDSYKHNTMYRFLVLLYYNWQPDDRSSNFLVEAVYRRKISLHNNGIMWSLTEYFRFTLTRLSCSCYIAPLYITHYALIFVSFIYSVLIIKVCLVGIVSTNTFSYAAVWNACFKNSPKIYISSSRIEYTHCMKGQLATALPVPWTPSNANNIRTFFCTPLFITSMLR